MGDGTSEVHVVRSWRLALLLLALIAAIVGCSPTPGSEVATLGRGQISFGSVGFASVNPNDYSTLFPYALAEAKGLGHDSWTASLSGDVVFVLACVNHGSNVPQGEFNTPPFQEGIASSILDANNTRNGRASFSLDSGLQGLAGIRWLWESSGQPGPEDVTSHCPNDNYTFDVVGALWNRIDITLYAQDGSYADSVSFVCQDPANPSAETCPVATGRL